MSDRFDRPLTDDALPPDLAEARREDHERITAIKNRAEPASPVQAAADVWTMLAVTARMLM